MELEEFYLLAKKYIIEQGFGYEIDAVDERKIESITEDDFFKQYMYVVINAGLRNQVAEVLFRRAIKNGLRAIAHKGKRKAIEEGIKRREEWFATLNSLDTTEQILDFLESLPWIGAITKYHLARNLGVDVAKPDRHLVRIAKKFGYSDVQQMCKEVAEKTGDRIGTVDVILWRAMNLSNGNIEELLNL